MISNKGLGFLPRKKVLAVANAAVTANKMYALDVTGAIGTTPDTNLGTVVEPTATNMHGFLVLADNTLAAGAIGTFTLVGEHDAVVTATAILEGDRLCPEHSFSAGVSGTSAAGIITVTNLLAEPTSNSHFPSVAIALEASSAGANTTIRTYFNGNEMWKRFPAANVAHHATILVAAEVSNARAITIQLLDSRGNDVNVRTPVQVHVLLDGNGDAFVVTGGSTGIAIGTDGALQTLVAKKEFIAISEADGDIDLTWTDTGTEAAFLMVVLPNGRYVISSALTNA